MIRPAMRTTPWYLLLLGVVLFNATCTDSLFDGNQVVEVSLDVEGLLQAADPAPIPIDSVVIELRRVSDSTIAASMTIDVDTVVVSTDGTVAIDVQVILQTDPEEFHLYIAVFGNGTVWFEVRDRVTITAGDVAISEVDDIAYVGPGADGTELRVTPADTIVTGGDSVLVTGTVYEGQTAVVGAPVWFESSDPTNVPEPTQVAINQAWVHVPAALNGSVVIIGNAFTRSDVLTGTADIAYFPRPDRLEIVSGNDQNLIPGQQSDVPLVVQLLDAAGDPFTRGYDVVFEVVSGPTGTAVDPTTVVTDAEGLAQTTLTAGDSPGAIQISAGGEDITSVTFAASVADVSGPANVTVSAGQGQTAVVGTALTVAPAVLVTDIGGNPVADVEVVFAVESGGGSVTDGIQTTDVSGIATVGGWTLGTAIGANTLSATVSGLSPVTFTATGVADVPDTIFVVSGNNQSADAGTALPDPLVVEVQDQYGNPSYDVNVVWTALDGSMAFGSGETDTEGRAQNTWTLGTNTQSQTATATVDYQQVDLPPAVFSATAVFQTPTILLSLVGADRIPVGGSATLEVTLTSPAPAGGTIVLISADNPAIIEVQAPPEILLNEGETTGQIGLNALTSGVTAVRATAAGYSDGALAVEASAFVLSLPTTLNVPFGGTASIPVQISTPAPVGGETVTLISSDPGVVGVQTPTVTIPAGQQTANGVVSGVFPGTATVTGTSTTHGTAQSTVSTTANLDITPNSASLNASFGTDVLITLQSGGSSIAAPAGGITVTLTAADPTCLAAASPLVIPAGLVNVTSSLSYGGSATLPCATTLTATAPDIDSDEISVTVNPAPGITVYTATLGAGLQINTYAYLGAGNHGGRDVTITSTNPQLFLVSPDESTPGSESITVTVADGTRYVYYHMQGVEGVTGEADITVSALGFNTGANTITVVQPGVRIYGLAASPTTLSSDDAFEVRVGVPNVGATTVSEQAVRAGAPAPLTATVASSDAGVGELVTSALRGGSVTVEITEGQWRSPTSVANGGVALDALTAGTTTVSATIPGYITTTAASQAVTVTAPGITAYSATVGAGLQVQSYAYLQVGSHGGRDVTFTSSNPQVLLVSPDASTAGSESITVTVADGTQYVYFYLQGVEGATGEASITVSAPDFSSGANTITVVQPGVRIYGVPASLTTLSNDDPFDVRVGVPNVGATTVSEQAVRAGAPAPLTATVVSSDAGVGELVTSTLRGASVTVEIAEGQWRSPTTVETGGVALDPLAGGETTVSATIPGYITTTAASQTVSITQPGIQTYAATVGGGLQIQRYAYLEVASHGGRDVTFTSSNPQVFLVSPDESTAGSESTTVTVADGYQYVYYYVQGVEGAVDTAIVTVTADGFATATDTTIVVQPGVRIYGLGSSPTTLSNDDPFEVRVGIPNTSQTTITEQAVRAGAPGPLTATVVSSAPGVGELVTTGLRGGAVTVEIAEGQWRSPTTVENGGVALDPLTAGATTVSATIAGYIPVSTATQTVTVTAPTITAYETTVGAGLQVQSYAYLQVGSHGGRDVTFTSSNPQVFLVSPDASTAGSESITVTVADGAQYAYFYLQGVEGASGTAVVTVSADGFLDGTNTITVVQPGVQISGLTTSTTAGSNDDPFEVRVGIPITGQTSVSAQAVRAGAPAPLTATVVSSAPSIGELVTTALRGGTVTVQITAGEYRSPTTVANGGVAFAPLDVGTTTVSTTIPGYISTTAASQTVSVNSP